MNHPSLSQNPVVAGGRVAAAVAGSVTRISRGAHVSARAQLVAAGAVALVLELARAHAGTADVVGACVDALVALSGAGGVVDTGVLRAPGAPVAAAGALTMRAGSPRVRCAALDLIWALAVALPPGRDVDGNAGLLARALVSAVAAVRAGDGRGGDDENDVAALGCLSVRAAAHAPARAIGNRIEIGRI